jgi:hypothetical protein
MHPHTLTKGEERGITEKKVRKTNDTPRGTVKEAEEAHESEGIMHTRSREQGRRTVTTDEAGNNKDTMRIRMGGAGREGL